MTGLCLSKTDNNKFEKLQAKMTIVLNTLIYNKKQHLTKKLIAKSEKFNCIAQPHIYQF